MRSAGTFTAAAIAAFTSSTDMDGKTQTRLGVMPLW
jgi:hypothetical protein